MKMIDLVQQRRSCRIYSEQKIELEKIDQLKKIALSSPTSKNNRPWEFVFIDDKFLLEELRCANHTVQLFKKMHHLLL